jgi:hypothetical protein
MIYGLSGAALDDQPANSSSPEKKIPFRLERNRVILQISVNGSRPLDLILDTGMPMNGVYLFHKELVEELDIQDGIEVQVGGAGSGESSYAIMADSQTLSSAGAQFVNQMVIIAQSQTTQTFPTDGVIGYTLFGSYAVEIDYDDQIITLHDSSEQITDSTWEAIPIRLEKNIPFLEVSLAVAEKEEMIPITVYIDFASGDALELLVRDDMKFKLPDSMSEDVYLGTGLSGDITGKTGRISRFGLGSYELNDVTATFSPAEVRSKQEGADGILCNDALRRFNVIFDYEGFHLYIKPNGYYDQPFE